MSANTLRGPDDANKTSPFFPYAPLKGNARAKSWQEHWTLQWLVALAMYFLMPGGFGVMVIAFFNLVVQAIHLKGTGTVETAVILVYFIVILFVFSVGAVNEAAAELIKAINHGMKRILSIFVIGLSDLGFRGSTVAAATSYYAFVIALLAAGYYAASSLAQISHEKEVFALLSGKESVYYSSPLQLFSGGLALICGLFFFLLPLLAIILPGWRKMTDRPKLKLFDKQKSTAAPKHRKVRVAHLSDLHVTDLVDPRHGAIVAAFTGANAFEADIIALTGDLTDKGTVENWDTFLQLPLIARRDPRLVLVPGNHDLNTWSHSVFRSFLTVEALNRSSANWRAYFYLQVACQVMGDRTWIVCPFSKSVRRLSNVYNQAALGLASWADGNGNDPRLLQPLRFLASIFPMAVETHDGEAGGKVVTVVWNTVKGNRWAVLNAIGELGADQIARGEQLLAHQAFSESPLLHLMHHQLAVPRAEVKSRHEHAGIVGRIEAMGMGLETAQHFLNFIRARSQRTCVLHGHHHKYFACREEKTGLIVVSTPSSKFGTESSYSDDVKAGTDITWLALEFEIDGNHIDLTGIAPR